MASSREFVDYVADSLSEAGDVSFRAMMGEYVVYYRDKVIGGIYDDRFLVKSVPSADAMLPGAAREIPYEGAREMLLVEDTDNREAMRALLEAMYDELPEPRKRKRRRQGAGMTGTAGNRTELVFTAGEFDPDTVFTSGQTFRFSKTDDGAWEGTAYASAVRVEQDGDVVRFTATGPGDEALWRRYTDAARDYDALFPDADGVLKEAMRYGRGLRVLRQEPFETLISFIVSANNNIPRISGILNRLCEACGEKTQSGVNAFPTPESMLTMSEADFRAIGAGYRAPYLLRSAERAADTDFEALESEPYDVLRKELLRFSGVGPKVADCIALFGFGRAEAFPVDVWVRRIMEQLYGDSGTPAAIRARAEERFGPDAGIAQQYLFHYARAVLERGT